MPMSREEIAAQRERKIRDVMAGWAPIWLVSDEYRPREDSLIFGLVYQHPQYGWVNQRFKYDGYNDVLYHMGEQRLSEEDTLPIQEQEPYLPGAISSRVPNAPAYRQNQLMAGIAR